MNTVCERRFWETTYYPELGFNCQFCGLFKISGKRAIVHPRENHGWKYTEFGTEADWRQEVLVL